jgi:hypothetical protein
MRGEVLVVAGIGICLAVFSHAERQTGQGNAEAVAAAQKRQETARTVEVEFKWTEVVQKGSLVNSGHLVGVRASSKATYPPTDTTLESVNRIVIDGDKVRFENNHLMWIGSDGQPIKSQSVALFNGSLGKVYYPIGIGATGATSGRIERDGRSPGTKAFIPTPITMTFRGLDPAFVPHGFAEMKPTGVTLPIDESHCQEYAIKLSTTTERSFWLDPAKGFVVRRMCDRSNNKPTTQTDIQYRPDDVLGWVPESWVHTEYAPAGTVRKTARFGVTKARLNEPQPAELFDIQFPPGCEVYDSRNDKSYWVQPDGSMREFDKFPDEEAGATVELPGASWYRQNKWLVLGLGVAFVVLGAAWRARKRKPSAAPNGQ